MLECSHKAEKGAAVGRELMLYNTTAVPLVQEPRQHQPSGMLGNILYVSGKLLGNRLKGKTWRSFNEE
jgi:hypothetical protein